MKNKVLIAAVFVSVIIADGWLTHLAMGQTTITNGSTTGEVKRDTGKILGPTVVPGLSRYVYRVYYGQATQQHLWSVTITDPANGTDQATVTAQTTGTEGNLVYYEATAEFKNEPAVVQLKFTGGPAELTQEIVVIKVDVKTHDEDEENTYIRLGADREATRHYAWIRANVTSEAGQGGGVWITEHTPGYEWDQFTYQNGNSKPPRPGIHVKSAGAIKNQNTINVAIDISASVTLTAPQGKANAITDIDCGFIQNTEAFVDATNSISRYWDPVHQDWVTSSVVHQRPQGVDWLPNGHANQGIKTEEVPVAIVDSLGASPPSAVEETFPQALTRMGFGNFSNKEDNGWPWYNTPWHPANGQDITRVMTMTDSPSKSVPIPTVALQQGGAFPPAANPPGPPNGLILNNAWSAATRTQRYTTQVCARTRQRFFNSQWSYWAYMRANWEAHCNFIAILGVPFSTIQFAQFAKLDSVTGVPVHIVPSTINFNCPFERWLPEVP